MARDRTFAATAVLCLLCASIAHQAAAAQLQWGSWGGNTQNWRFSDYRCVDKTKLTGLTAKWTVNTDLSVVGTPTTCGSNVYFTDFKNIYKVNAKTGATVWKSKMDKLISGVHSRTSLVFSSDCKVAYAAITKFSGPGKSAAYLLFINTADGSNAQPPLQLDTTSTSRITCSPTIYNGAVYVGIASTEEGTFYCCKFQGKVVKVNVAQNKIAWATKMAPFGYSGIAVWGSSPAIDKKRNQVCVGTGNNYRVPVGVIQCIQNSGNDLVKQANCVDNKNYNDAIVCLDIATGLVKWSWVPLKFKPALQAFDVWTGVGQDLDFIGRKPSLAGVMDADFAQAPIIIPAKNGSTVPTLVIGAQKNGIIIALNAGTGKPVWGPFNMHQGLAAPYDKNGHPYYGSCTNGKLFCTSMFYFLQGGGTVACHDAFTGVRKWQVIVTPKGPFGPLMCTPDMVIAPLFDVGGNLLFLDMTNGKELGRFKAGTSIFSAPAIVNGTMYLGLGYQGNGGRAGTSLLAIPVPVKAGAQC